MQAGQMPTCKGHTDAEPARTQRRLAALLQAHQQRPAPSPHEGRQRLQLPLGEALAGTGRHQQRPPPPPWLLRMELLLLLIAAAVVVSAGA